MTRTLNVGFIPLLDCAPLVAAAECGFAREEGLELRLVRETSWANIRDRVIVGHFDAAQMLGPMVVAASLGAGQLRVPMVAPVALNLGGNGITVSTRLWERLLAAGAAPGAPPLQQARALAKVVAQRAQAGREPLCFAMVFPFSCHNYELRYWLAAGGLDPDLDLQLVVLPPPLLVDALRSGQIDGFCVGEPWNSLAVAAGIGTLVCATTELWPHSPEKVLGMRADRAVANEDETARLVRAIVAAGRWCDEPRNHPALAALLAQTRHVGAPAPLLQRALAGRLPVAPDGEERHHPDFIQFSHHWASVPWAEHAGWFYGQMRLWGQIEPAPGQLERALASFRPDLLRAALEAVPHAALPPPRRPGGVGPFFDGRDFELDRLDDYLAGFGRLSATRG